MKNELKDKEKLIKLKNSLKPFFYRNDCKHLACEHCEDKRICDSMYRLDIALKKYLRK